jgi:thiosulfate dehydrogenase
MNFFKSSWCPVIISLIFIVALINNQLFSTSEEKSTSSFYNSYTNQLTPDTNAIPSDHYGDMVRYGKDLISNTSYYLGPKGIISQSSNGLNCQSCHIDAGLKPYGNSFAAVASSYPQVRGRSGKLESIEFRINECMERSLNGKRLDPESEEMKAMITYLEWVGKDVPKGVRPEGSGIVEIPLLDRAANPERGKKIYLAKCQRCHGENGQGIYRDNAYLYPPLWGEHSFNVSAGLYRLTRMASFIKYNMPFDSVGLGYKLPDEDVWDVSAYINSQPRPQKTFSYDWPDITKKPFDHPFGPYTDGFSEQQHKYGPFKPIKAAIAKNKK